MQEGGGVAILPDRTAFAGSISTMRQCLQHIVHVVGISLRDALQMATLTPARIVGADDRVGQLAPGCYADILVLDPAMLEPRIIMFGGQVVASEGE